MKLNNRVRRIDGTKDGVIKKINQDLTVMVKWDGQFTVQIENVQDLILVR